MLKRVLSTLLTLVLVLGTGAGAAFAAEPRVVNVSTAAELIAAIRDLQPADTIVLAAGTYDVERQLGDMSFGGQTGWYLPLWQDGVTLQGSGPANVTLTSSTYSANGAWASQDFISVWANGVTIDGVTIHCKQDTNKAIEVMGRDFTLRNTDVMTNPLGPWPGWPDDVFSGSVYFSPQLAITGTDKFVGTSSLENVYIEGAWVSAPLSAVTSGTISLTDVTVDWVQAAYAPYWTLYGIGMMSANPAFSAGDGVRFIVDETAESLADQASARMPAGADLEYVATHDLAAEISGRAFTEVQNAGIYPAGADFFFHLYGDAGDYADAYVSPADAGPYLYGWHFVAADVDPSFEATFYPGIGVKTTLDTAKADMIAAADLPDNDLHAVELDFTHGDALPGPAAVTLLLDPALAGLQFDLVKYSGGDMSSAALGDPVERVTVDPMGYATVHVDSGDLWYLVQYLEHTVTFADWDGSTIATQAVVHGEAAVPPADPVRSGYTFTGWDVDFSNVTADLTVTATYEQALVEFVRHDGATRFETAADAAIADFPGGADTAIIANAWDFPDALAASTLAGVADAPILLVDAGPLNMTTTDALAELGVENIYIVGGPKVVSDAAEEVLSEQHAVTRLGGADRYETARLVADEAVRLGASTTKAFLVYGGNFADALAVSSIAAQEQIPVLLTRTDVLHPEAEAFITGGTVTDVYVAGGEKVVSFDVSGRLVDEFGIVITRWAGLDRYETAAAVANGAKAAFVLTYNNVGIASGSNFPDALTAGAALGVQDGLLMLTDPLTLSAPTEGVIVANADDIMKVEFFGGTVALSQAVEDAVRGLLE